MGLPSPKSIEENASALVRGWQALAGRVRPDHATIQGRRSRVDIGGADDFKVHLAVAPARRLRTQRLPRKSDACQFVEATFARQVEIDYSSTTFLRVAVVEDRPYPGTVAFYPHGLVEVVLNVPHSTTRDGAIVLDILDIFEPMGQLARAVRNGSHAELFSYRHLRRMDWFANVASTISGHSGSQHWAQLDFPGRAPRGQTGQTPFTAVTGLIPGSLRGLPSRATPDRLERITIEGFLEDNGYDGTDGAVADTVDALEARISG